MKGIIDGKAKSLKRLIRDDKDFTRKRKLTFTIVIMIILNLIKDRNNKGYEITMNQFWSECKRFDIELLSESPPTKSAFTLARKKIKPSAFRYLLKESADLFEEAYKDKYLWHGLNVVACDGSKYTLPASDELIKEFGCQSCGKSEAHYPQALVSMLFNVRSKIIYNTTIAPNKGNERLEFLRLANSLDSNDLAIMDRGYPSYKIIKYLLKKKIHFLIRLPIRHTFKIVEDFNNSDEYDSIVELSIPNWKKVKVRLLKILFNGEQKIFISSLLNQDLYSKDEITDLYKERWEIEEQYKKNKYLFYIENFHAKSSDGIKQEIFAQMYMNNLTRTACADAEIDNIDCDDEPAFKNAVYTVDRYFNEFALCDNDKQRDILFDNMIKDIKRVRYKKRKGRKYPRRSFKRVAKWSKKRCLT